MSKKYRLFVYLASLILLCVISSWITGSWYQYLTQFWFSAGIMLLILLSLVDQPFFSKDANIFVNAITGLISLLAVQKENYDWVFCTFLIWMIYLIISSYVLMWIRKNVLNESKKSIQFFSRFNRYIGNPKVIFSCFFLWGAILQFGLNSSKIIPLFWFWFIFIIFNIPSIARIFSTIKEKTETNNNMIIGTLLGLQGKEIFLVKLLPLEDREFVDLFDPVEFSYNESNKIKNKKGIVIENYYLNEELWIKVLSNSEIARFLDKIKSEKILQKNYVYKIEISSEDKKYLKTGFAGLVTENSDIEKINFIYNSETILKSGNLLEIDTYSGKTYYQITNAVTKQKLLSEKNQANFIIGEALQLGFWDNKRNSFDKFGWVPDINSTLRLYSNTIQPNINDELFQVGTITDTNLPVLMDISKAVSHHMAILGVTGTGKSVLVREIIKKYLQMKSKKIFVVDITGEHKGALPNSRLLFEQEDINDIYKKFSEINNIRDINYNKDNSTSRQLQSEIYEIVKKKINSVIKDTKYIDILDLPNVDNNQNMLDFLSYCFRSIFEIAKADLYSHDLPQICIVLEEAHTIIPEWNFSSDFKSGSNKTNHAVNAISQVALQGRKYNVGLLIVAQRTATVSKTVLTQCNTIIAFQEFDRTTMDYLSNYFGESMVNILPSLKFRQAIASGKAFSSTVPMIFTVPELGHN